MLMPFIAFTMSPGLAAPPEGMFSHVGTIAFKLMGNFISAAAQKEAITEAAPNMSYFISSMPGPGFNEMPPVSKVMPLPTNT